MFISAIIVVLFLLPFVVDLGTLKGALGISTLGVGLSVVTFFSCLATRIWLPPLRWLSFTAFGSYLLVVITCGSIIASGAGISSAFMALWVTLTIFAAAFGAWGLAALSLMPLSYAMYLTFTATTTFNTYLVLSLATIVPLTASYLIFRNKSSKDTANNTYNRLASELSQATNKAEIVINAIDEGVMALSSKGVIELMNPAAQRIIGWGRADALGLDYRSVLKLTDGEGQTITEAKDPVSQVLSTNASAETRDLSATTGSGKRVAVSIVVSPIGQPGQGVIVVFRNITREQAEEREQAEFISTASHEMRTPVASIEGYLGLALNPNTAQIDDKARDFITKAQGAAQHLGRLFQDLLDVTKAEDGRLSSHPNVIDVSSFIGDVVDGLRTRADEKQLRLFYKPEADNKPGAGERVVAPVLYANVDNDHLREIVSNLVENAIKYTPQGDVVIDAKGSEDHITISIKDSGIGIPREDIPHLFQKFYRVDNSQTREIGGTGLGLYLCRRLAEIMGGRLWVESEFGKGSTFYLEIPRTDRQEAMRLIEAAENSPVAEPIQAESRIPIQTQQNESYPDALAVSDAPGLNNNSPLDLGAPQPPTAPAPMQAPTDSAPPNPAEAMSQPPHPQAPTLSTIESNPQAFMPSARTSSLQVPVRGPENTNQP